MAFAAAFIKREEAKTLNALGGGGRRAQIIVVMAATLGLDSADKAAVSAMSGQLKDALSLTNMQVGLLLAVVSFVGAAITLPAGVLADRYRRKTILLGAVALWAIAMIASGLSNSYMMLFIARFFLGAVTAAAWPCIASLNGDIFPAQERASIYGVILTGELAGTAIGFFVSAEISEYLGWHWSFFVMALPSVILLWAVWRYLPEPERGGQSWLSLDAEGGQDAPLRTENADDDDGPAERIAKDEEIEPRPELLDGGNREARGWIDAMRYCLMIPSYRRLVVISALVYFFFSGVRAFGMIYFSGHYGLSHQAVIVVTAIIGAGALFGVIGGGRLSRALFARGWLAARVIVPALMLFTAVPFLAMGLWTAQPWIGVPLLTVGAAALAAAVAPVDAARLDVVQSNIWGRAESGRSALRYVFEGIAPVLIGALSGWIGGANSLTWAFAVVLVSVLVAGLVAVPLHKIYPRDVASAAERRD